MIFKYRVPALAAAALVALTLPALAAPPSGQAGSHPGPAPSGASSRNSGGPVQNQVSQDAAARSRMHECGHQWSTMKKNGTAGTLTWKEFSATCLAYSK